MPVLCQHHKVPVADGTHAVDVGDDLTAIRHGDSAALHQVILDVDDDQGSPAAAELGQLVLQVWPSRTGMERWRASLDMSHSMMTHTHTRTTTTTATTTPPLLEYNAPQSPLAPGR